MIVKTEEITKHMGDLIGWGCSREVFTHTGNSRLVIKKAKYRGKGNLREHRYFNHCRRDVSRFLCPVRSISRCHGYLVMPKCKTLKSCLEDEYKESEIVNFIQELEHLEPNLWDVDWTNIGFYKAKLVLFDYESLGFREMERIFGDKWMDYR